MGDLCLGRVLGRYFGRLAAVCALAATFSSLAAGLVLDGARSYGHAGAALCALSLTASLAGLATTLRLRGEQERHKAIAPKASSFAEALAPVRDPRCRRLLAFQVAFSAAGGLAAVFYPLHMISSLHMGFARMALYVAATAAFRMLAAPLWGRVLDRAGARPVLAACAFALGLSPLLWIFPAQGRLWPLALPPPPPRLATPQPPP